MFLKLFILLSCVCIWLDALFSESDHLFSSNESSDNKTMEEDKSNATIRIETVIRKSDPFLSPAMIEFALMTIDLLFTKNNNFLEENESNLLNEDKDGEEKGIPIREEKNNENQIAHIEKQNKYTNYRFVFPIFFVAACLVLIGFTMYVLITDAQTQDFKVYITIQLILKIFIFIISVACLLLIRSFLVLTFHLDVEAFVLIFSCFCNIVYHMFYIFAFFSDKWENSEKEEYRDFVNTCLYISLLENTLSIFIASFQTYFILGMHTSSRKHNSDAKVGHIDNSGDNCIKELLGGSKENIVFLLLILICK